MTEGEARFPGETPLIRALTVQRSIRRQTTTNRGRSPGNRKHL